MSRTADEAAGRNLYGYDVNDPINAIDLLGLWGTSVHHQIVKDWLRDPIWTAFPWGGPCRRINVRAPIMKGSDLVDGVFCCGIPNLFGGFWAAQSPENAYQHGMRNGDTDPEQTVEEASSLWAQFIEEKLALARSTSDTARASKNCKSEKDALVLLGQAFHAYSDSLSPAHEGFQPWYSPKHFADAGAFWSDPIPPWLQFVHDHSQQETLDVYRSQ